MFSRFATKLTDIVFGYTSALFFGGYLCYTYLGSPLLVDGSSMSPELEDGDLLWMKRVRDVSTVKLGDIVTFYSPTESEKVLLTKKITATGGQFVQHYGKFDMVPYGHVWVEGVNEKSTDSKDFGPIPLNLIQGKVTNRIYPGPTKF